MKKTIVFYFCIFLFLTACKNDHPNKIAIKFYQEFYEGNLDNAETFLKEELDEFDRFDLQLYYADKIAPNLQLLGGIEDIVMKKEVIKGNHATVSLEVLYGDKKTKNSFDVEMSKVDGEWKVDSAY